MNKEDFKETWLSHKEYLLNTKIKSMQEEDFFSFIVSGEFKYSKEDYLKAIDEDSNNE